jgi:hypothetical protein
LKFFLNTRFYWRNNWQGDEITGKTAHVLSSNPALPNEQAAPSESSKIAVDK